MTPLLPVESMQEFLALTPKQQLFVVEYAKDQNGTQAALRAGYSRASAGSMAYDNLKIPTIKALTAAVVANSVQKALISVDQVAQDLMTVKEMSLGRVGQPKAVIIEGKVIELEVKDTNLAAANKSLELMGRHLGMFADKDTGNSLSNETMAAFFAGIKPTLGPPCARIASVPVTVDNDTGLVSVPDPAN